MKPKISVIVPIYNVEEYLEKCLDSLVNQTLKDIEIILINDGSPDNSEEIVNKYLKKYKEKIIYHKKENEGQGIARNYGINLAKGEFISFVDSDDYVDKTMFEKLYNKAKELGCNKIALGHHLDDVIETTLLSLFYGAEIKTMMPKLHSDNYPGIELIRPLYMVKERSIISFAKHNEITFLNCACKMTENKIIEEENSKRKEIKELIKTLRKSNKDIDHNIFKALDNVNLNCVLGTKTNGNYQSFLKKYDDKNS